MERKETALCAALIAVVVAGLVPHSAFADGDKDKKKKQPTVPIVISKPIIKDDPPPKK